MTKDAVDGLRVVEDEMGGARPFIVIDEAGIPLSHKGRAQLRRWKTRKAAQKVVEILNYPIPQ